MGKFRQICSELRPLIYVINWFSLSIFGISLPIFFKLCVRVYWKLGRCRQLFKLMKAWKVKVIAWKTSSPELGDLFPWKLGADIRWAFTGPMILWLGNDIAFRCTKIINGRPRECHNKKAQSIPSTKRKRNLPKTETTKLHVNNSRKTSSLFPNRGSWSTTVYNK